MTDIRSNAKKAVFNFENYEVPEFSYKKTDLISDIFNIGFDPKGIFFERDSIFELHLGFSAKVVDKENEENTFEVVVLKMTGSFKFSNISSIEDIPDYFYRNSLGILFPYLRAFVSTLTFQANLKPPIILPTLNLTQLEDELKKNVSIEK